MHALMLSDEALAGRARKAAAPSVGAVFNACAVWMKRLRVREVVAEPRLCKNAGRAVSLLLDPVAMSCAHQTAVASLRIFVSGSLPRWLSL